MGRRNFVIEGVSGAGKTTVCDELARRGYHAVHGDRELRPSNPYASHHTVSRIEPTDEADTVAALHKGAIWDRTKVLRHTENSGVELSFFCGGFRNHTDLLDLFDGVFVLEVDAETLVRRLSTRPVDEFGGRLVEQALILELHATNEDTPKGAIPMMQRDQSTRSQIKYSDCPTRISDTKRAGN